MRKYFLFIFIILLVQVNPALACSGGKPSTVVELVENAEVIVYGKLVQVDDAGQSAVLQVQSYWYGGPGPQYILLSLYEPASVTRNQERWSGGGCYYGVAPLPAGQDIAIFLVSNTNGSYSLAPGHFLNSNYYPFPTPTTTIPVYTKFEYDPVNTGSTIAETRLVTADEFAQMIEEITRIPPFLPLFGEPYPLLAPLLITTTNETRYLLPVDFSPPIKLNTEDLKGLRRQNTPGCSTVGCTGFSPNGLDSLYLDDINGRFFTTPRGETLSALAFLFSSTSDALALWINQKGQYQLHIYTLFYRRLRIQDIDRELFAQATLQLGENLSLIGSAAWTPDGRILAFSDNRGVWLWDVFAPNAPRLLMDEALPVRWFSNTGRYLALGSAGLNGFILDTVSGERLPDGALSPDDRTLLPYGADFSIIHLTPFLQAEVYGTEGYVLRQAIWKNNDQYLALACDQNTCYVNERAVVGIGGAFYDGGYAFDYEPDTKSQVVAKSGSVIFTRMDTPTAYYLYKHDLSVWLDGEITSIEWLPPLFYRG
jgi:hypothetical protein